MNEGSLLGVAFITSMVAALLALTVLVVTKSFRERRAQRRAAAAEDVRARVLVVLDPDLWVVPEVFGRRGGHAEQVTADLMAQLRGPDRQRLAAVLDAAGALEAAARRLRSRSGANRLEGLELLGLAGSRRYLPAVAACLEDEDREVRAAAARAIGHAGDPYFVGALLTALDERRVTSHTVSMALIRIGPSAAPPLLAALECRSPRVRPVVVDAIGVLRLTEAADRLAGLLTDLDVRRSAARALGRLGVPRTAPVLVAELVALLHRSDPHRDEGYAADLIEALGLIGDRRAVSVLTACLPGPHRISSVATTALHRLGTVTGEGSGGRGPAANRAQAEDAPGALGADGAHALAVP